MIRICDGIPADLHFIATRLSSDDRLELAATRDPDDSAKLVNDACRSQLCKVALDHEGCPVFAFGAQPIEGSDMAQVWGFKCEGGWHAILSVTKHIRRIMIPELRDLGVRRAICIVHPDNRRSLRWLQNLDFRARAKVGVGARNQEMILMQRDEPDADPV